jgi:NarL family two-component system response regulator LiaR
LHPAVARKLVTHCARTLDADPDALTEAETEVLKLLAHGLKNQVIGARLDMGERTVRFHISNILSKLRLENRTEAALYAMRTGLVSMEG